MHLLICQNLAHPAHTAHPTSLIRQKNKKKKRLMRLQKNITSKNFLTRHLRQIKKTTHVSPVLYIVGF